MTTRIFWLIIIRLVTFDDTGIRDDPDRLNDRHFLILAPHLAERVAHLADRGIGPHALEDRRHRVAVPARGLAQPVERPLHPVVVARPLQLVEPRQLRLGGRVVDVEDLDRLLVVLDEVVDADDDLLARSTACWN